MAKKQTINQADVLRHIEQRTAGADEARLDRLDALGAMTALRAELLDKESKRLADKYGANHPRVAEAGMRARAAAALQRSVRTEIGRASLAPPSPKDDAWAVFGIIRNPDGSPMRDALVVLADEGGRAVAPDPPATTDRDGFFQIAIPVAERKGRAAKAEGDAAKSPALHLEVLRTPTKRVAVDTVHYRPVAGAVDYRDIVVRSQKSGGREKA